MEFAIDEVNNEGGVKSLGGAPIQIVWADEESNPTKAITEAERLILQENVSFFHGLRVPPMSIGVAQLGDKYKIPMLGVQNPDSVFALNLKYVAHLMPPTQILGRSFVGWVKQLKDDYGIKTDRIVLTTSDDASGRSINEGMKYDLQKYGFAANDVGTVWTDPTLPDQTVNLLKIKALDPDVVLAQHVPSQALSFHRARVAQKWTSKIWIGLLASYTSKVIWQQLPKDVADAAMLRAGLFGTDLYADTLPDPVFQDWFKKFAPYAQSKKWVPDMTSWLGAQSGYLIYEILEKAASRDREKINDAMHTISLPTGHRHFISPPYRPAIEFEANGRLKTINYILTQFGPKGEVNVIYPKDLRVGEPWVK